MRTLLASLLALTPWFLTPTPAPVDWTEIKTAAEAYITEGSYALAQEEYARAEGLELGEADARWLSFRKADLAWRAAPQNNPDQSVMDAARRDLMVFVENITRPEQKDLVWAEASESIADLAWNRQSNWNLGGAMPQYRNALDYWAGAEDVEYARTRWLTILWRMDRPGWYQSGWRYGNRNNWIPLDLLESAQQVVRTDGDRARARMRLAQTLARNTSTPTESRRVRRLFDEALEFAGKSRWRDDVLYEYGEWLYDKGAWTRGEDGEVRRKRDQKAALALYRRIQDEYREGTSAYWKRAGERIDRILREELSVTVDRFFEPGSEIAYSLSWRNVEDVRLALYPVELNRDVSLVNPNHGNNTWLQTIDLGRRRALRTWRHATGIKDDHEGGQATLLLDDPPPTGAYVLEVRAGDVKSRDLILITDASLIIKAAGKKVLAWATDAQTGRPLSGADVNLFARCQDTTGNWYWIQRKARTSENGTAEIEIDRARWNAGIFASVKYEKGQAFSVLGSRFRSPSQGYRIYASTDRPAYRPDQTVNWKVVVREHRELDYTTPSGAKLSYQITGPRGSDIESGELTLSAFGSAWGSLETTPEMALGEYRVRFTDSDSQHIGDAVLFRLEEYKLPEFEVLVSTPDDPASEGRKKVFVLGDEVEASVEASYYFGGPVANAKVAVVVYKKAWSPEYRPHRRHGWFADHLRESSSRRWWGGNGEEVARKTVQTDAEGHATVAFMTPEGEGSAIEYTIEARVTDSSRREVIGNGNVRVMRHSYRVGLSTEHNLHRPDEQAKVTIKAQDANDNGVAAEGTVRLLRARWVEVWTGPNGEELTGDALAKRRGEGPFPPTWQRTRAEYSYEELRQTKVTTDAEGDGEWNLVPPGAGAYVVRWLSDDPRGGEIEGEIWLWVVVPGTRDIGFHHDGLGIVLDADTFAAGSPGHAMLVTEGSGRWVLFSVEAEGVIEWRVLHMEGTVKLVTVDIDERHVPNVYFRAHLVHGGVAHEAYAEVTVPPVRRFLDVAVTSDRDTYLPGEEGTLEVTVKDHEGKPVAAELGLALVDESVMAIQEDYAGDPRTFFYGHRRSHLVQTSGTFHQQPLGSWNFDKKEGILKDRVANEADGLHGADDFFLGSGSRDSSRESRMKKSKERGRASGPASPGPSGPSSPAAGFVGPSDSVPPGGEGGGGPAVTVRSDFRETAVWQPDLVTDASGKASVKVDFPDTTTRWRATARATDAGASFGHFAEPTARTTMPLIVRAQLPRFLVAGDVAVLSAILNNNTEQALSASANLEVTGLEAVALMVDGEPRAFGPHTVVVPAGGDARVDWRVRATAAGPAAVVATATAGDLADGMRRELPVLDHGIEAFLADSGKLDADELGFDFELPEARRDGTTVMTVKVAPSLAVTMLDALPYLADYPYGCVEQTLSRFVPTAVVAKTLEDQGISRADVLARSFGGVEARFIDKTHPKGTRAFEHMDDVVRRSLDRIAGAQRSDGSWGWWPGGSSDTFMTAYCVWALGLAKGAGLEMSDAMQLRGADWLGRHLVTEEDRPDLQAWMLHAYTAGNKDGRAPWVRNGKEFTNLAFDNLWEKRRDLNAYTLALFALSAHELGRDDEARTLVRNLANGVMRDDPGSSTIGVDHQSRRAGNAHWGEDGVIWRWSNGGVEATAFALRALIAIDPENDLIDDTVNWLVKNRRGAQWKSTRDTAIVVLAMSDYLRATGEAARDVEYEVSVNGTIVAHETIKAADGLAAPMTFTVPVPRSGPNAIVIRRLSGDGSLYWAVQASFFSEEEPIPARGSDLFLRRDYFRLVGKPTLLKGEVFDRIPLADGDEVESGDRIEVVLTVEGENHYEYLLFEDLKPAGLEATELKSGVPFYIRELRADETETRFGSGGSGAHVRITGDRAARRALGYTGRSRWVYRELRDEKIALFVDQLPEGVWEMRYVLRAEVPGHFHALPTLGHAMYVPEIRGNGAEVRLLIRDSAK